MSLASPYSEVYQVADGATTVFAFGQAFTPISKNYVKCIVYFQDGTSSVPEFVVNLEQGSISIVTLTTPQGELLNVIPAGAIVRIFRDVPESQDVTASQLKVMTAKQLEKSFDDIVAMIQEVSFSDQHKTLRLTETQRDVFLQKLGEAEDKAVLMWDNEKRSLVASRFTEEAIEAAIDYAIQTAEEAKVISEEAKTISQNALLTAEEARVKSQDAIDTSLTALNTANEANDKSDRAVADSTQALSVANQANTKSDEAKSIAQEANTKSNQAVATANSADAKSDQAITTSQEALAGVQSAVEAAESATIAAQQATEAAEAATEAIATKQDKLTAGTGIEITENNVINNTQTSAEWGNITGTLANQTDLQNALNGKQDSLPDGTAGQILKKTADGVEWADESGGTVTDVQVDGTSVVSGGVANVVLTGKQDVLSTSDTVIVDGSTLNTNNIVWRKW